MKLIFYCSILTATFMIIRAALNIECDFDDRYIRSQNQSYYACTVQNALNITKPDTIIESSTGSHTNGRNNSMVESFWILSRGTVNYFPSGLKKLFPKLLAIVIQSVKMKEIHQNDLKAFTGLENLMFYDNHVEYLEKDLFKFNTKLKTFSAQNNKISYINPHVFDHLSNLNYLYLGNNVCELSYAEKNQTQVFKIIQEVKEKCSNFDSLIKLSTQDTALIHYFNNKIHTLQNENTKLQTLQDENEKDLIKVEIFIAILAILLFVVFIIACYRKKVNIQLKNVYEKPTKCVELNNNQSSEIIDLRDVINQSSWTFVEQDHIFTKKNSTDNCMEMKAVNINKESDGIYDEPKIVNIEENDYEDVNFVNLQPTVSNVESDINSNGYVDMTRNNRTKLIPDEELYDKLNELR